MIESKKPGMLYYSYVGRDPPSIKAWERDQETLMKIGGKRLDDCLETASPFKPPQIYEQKMSDKLYYIFTSGTTGLPKAAVIRHHRYIWIGMILHNLFNISDDDILYLTLPQYHNNAGTIGSCQGVILGTGIVLREKFSASQFWDDCIRYNCTVSIFLKNILIILLTIDLDLFSNRLPCISVSFVDIYWLSQKNQPIQCTKSDWCSATVWGKKFGEILKTVSISNKLERFMDRPKATLT